MIKLQIRHRQGDFTLSAAFETSGGVTALFGPSGSGKTTLINSLAGLIRADEARIEVDGIIWQDSASGTFLPVHQRRIGYVFQEGRLFPHMSVAANLGYGQSFTPKSERRVRMADIVDLLGIGHVLNARPGQLSGGEKSRVAIGRALLASPRLMLMDEPLASLDQARKEEILPYLAAIRDEWTVPILYVSHARAEVERLARKVVMLDGGTVEAVLDIGAFAARGQASG